MLRLYLAAVGFGLVVTIAVCEAWLRVIEESQEKARRKAVVRHVQGGDDWVSMSASEDKMVVTYSDGRVETFPYNGGELSRF